MVIQKENEENNNRYDDVVEEPPFHDLHVGGGGQSLVNVGVQCVHH